MPLLATRIALIRSIAALWVGIFLALIPVDTEARSPVVSTANTNYDFDRLPPGVKSCRDPWVKIIYGETRGWWQTSKRDYYPERRMMSDINVMSQEVSRDSWYIEPAFYLTNEQGGYSLEDKIPNLKKKAPAMYYFSIGINNYFNRWIRVRASGPKHSIEDYFIRSIMYSLIDPKLNDLERFEFYNDLSGRYKGNQKEGVLLSLSKKIGKLPKGNRDSTSPNNPFNRKLVIMWSAYWLAEHYKRQGDTNLSKILINNFENILKPSVGKIRPYNWDKNTYF